MKRALITGASGFVGANLARRLLRDGHEVWLILRENYQSWRLEEVVSACHIVTGDITDRDAVSRAFGKARPEWVFHLAAFGAYSSQTGFEQMSAVNLLGAAVLLDAAVASGVECFVQSGSSSEYGYKPVASREQDVLQPNSHYAITKAAATHYCQLTACKSGMKAVTLRLYSIYGPWEEPMRLIPSLLIHCLSGALPALASPLTARDFVYVDDAVDAFIRVASANAIPLGAVYNVASGAQTTLGQLVSEAREIFGITTEPSWETMPARAWDTDIWVGDATALHKATEWRPETNLREGLLRTIHWLQTNPRLLSLYRSCILTKAK
jgi:dolichol-phosphate mannosyltransferase